MGGDSPPGSAWYARLARAFRVGDRAGGQAAAISADRVMGGAAGVAKPDVVSMPSPNASARPSGTRIDTIVLHHTAGGGTAQDVGRYFQNPSAQVSAHYTVGKDGTILQSAPAARRRSRCAGARRGPAARGWPAAFGSSWDGNLARCRRPRFIITKQTFNTNQRMSNTLFTI